MPTHHRLITFSLLSALIAVSTLAIIGCSDSSSNETPPTESSSPTATPTPIAPTPTTEPTATTVEPTPAAVIEQQSESKTAAAATEIAAITTATAIAGEKPMRVLPTIVLNPTQAPPPKRAIATGPVNRIAFEDGLGSLFTVNSDGSGLVMLADSQTLPAGFVYTFPIWSPDGDSVLFSSYVSFNGAAAQSALHRADADGNGEIVTLTYDFESRSGIGPVAPHFSSWSPNGERIAVTKGGEFGIGTMLVGSFSGEAADGIGIGAPLYVDWAPDARSLLVHEEAGLHIVPVDGVISGDVTTVGVGSIAFNSAAWAPDSQSFAHVENISGNPSVVITKTSDVDTDQIIEEGDRLVRVGWSPDGRQIAIAKSSGGLFHTLSIYDLAEDVEQTIHEGPLSAFWWSPDSSKIAIVEEATEIEFTHNWSVLDVDSGDVTLLATYFASDQFLFGQDFFEQYVESHNIWSPDNSKIVISGLLLDLEKVIKPNGDLALPPEFDSQIWVLDISGLTDPVSVGRGTLATWSAQ
jgi:dipeptidyl aminopeptidase/acylaminoacyl peptidase